MTEESGSMVLTSDLSEIIEGLSYLTLTKTDL